MRFLKKYSNILTKEVLAQAYAELKTLKDVGKHFGISPECIRKYMITYGLPYNKKVMYKCDETFFKCDTEQAFYWAGFLAADGNISDENDITISLSSKDRDHLHKFKEQIKCDSIISTRNVKNNFSNIESKYYNKSVVEITSQSRFRFRSKQIASDLARFNIVPRKTYIYAMPQWLTEHHLVRDFIRGYHDGDGWYSQYLDTKTGNNRLHWGICGTFEFINQIQLVINKNCNFPMGCGSIVRQKNIYKLTYGSQHQVAQIVDYLTNACSIFLERKAQIATTAQQRDRGTIILNLDKNELEKLYNQLHSAKLVANQLNCSRGTVYNYMKKFGIAIIEDNKLRGERISKRKAYSLSKEELIKSFSELKSISAVAQKMHCCKSTIIKYCKIYNIVRGKLV